MGRNDASKYEIAKFSPQLQVKLCLKDELALISANPATHPHMWKFIFQHFAVNIDQVSSGELEDGLHFWQMEDNIIFFANGRQHHFL